MSRRVNVRKILSKRILFSFVGLPLLLAATLLVAVQYRFYVANRLQLYSTLPTEPALERNARIVIFAPHCDDESLAAAGLIRMAGKAGCKVKVVTLTNGDGFRAAVGREYHRLRVSPRDCIRFAKERQKDTLAATAVLGLSADDVIFLGYPDRGLLPMWTTYWSPERPYRSLYTKMTRSPYANSYRPHAIYCGQYVFQDIRSILAVYRPTAVYVPHPSDDHPDHAIAYSFVTAALASLQSSPRSPLKKTLVRTYLVHRGGWPTPWGWKPTLPLRPPAGLADLDTTWDELSLSKDVILLKRKAIRTYDNQMAMMGKFLLSFARRNELFGGLKTREVTLRPDGKMFVDGETDDWKGIRPAARDPVRDSILRSFGRAGDVRSLYLCADRSNLYVRLDFARRLSPRVVYHVGVRSFGKTTRGGQTRFWEVMLRPGRSCEPSGVYYAWNGSVLELATPRSALEPLDRVYVGADTSAMRVKIDKTGWRGYSFPADRARYNKEGTPRSDE